MVLWNLDLIVSISLDSLSADTAIAVVPLKLSVCYYSLHSYSASGEFLALAGELDSM